MQPAGCQLPALAAPTKGECGCAACTVHCRQRATVHVDLKQRACSAWRRLVFAHAYRMSVVVVVVHALGRLLREVRPPHSPRFPLSSRTFPLVQWPRANRHADDVGGRCRGGGGVAGVGCRRERYRWQATRHGAIIARGHFRNLKKFAFALPHRRMAVRLATSRRLPSHSHLGAPPTLAALARATLTRGHSNRAMSDSGPVKVAATFAPSARVAGFQQDVWSIFSPMAAELKAVNLGQGFPNVPAADFIKQAACDAVQGVAVCVVELCVCMSYSAWNMHRCRYHAERQPVRAAQRPTTSSPGTLSRLWPTSRTAADQPGHGDCGDCWG